MSISNSERRAAQRKSFDESFFDSLSHLIARQSVNKSNFPPFRKSFIFSKPRMIPKHSRSQGEYLLSVSLKDPDVNATTWSSCFISRPQPFSLESIVTLKGF